MEAIARFCVCNPLRVVLAAVLAMSLGVLAWRSIPIEYLYDPSPPQLGVFVQYPGATADLVSTTVTTRFEADLRAIPGVRRLVSRSVDGSASLVIDFDRRLSFDSGERQVRERVGRLRYQMPREVRDPKIVRVGGGNDQTVIDVAVGSERQGLADATDWVETVVRPRLQAVSGAGEVLVLGDAPRQLDVEFDPGSASALGVSVEDLVLAIQRENVDVRTGYVTSPGQQRMLRVSGRLEQPASFERIPVRRQGAMIVRLGDVARVRPGAAVPSPSFRLDGRDCVSVKVFPLAGANVVEVADRLHKAIGELQTSAPKGMFISVVIDNSLYARGSLDSVERSMLEGAALTVLFVAIGLRSARSSFITSVTLPLSILLSITCLWALGYSLNLFTLLALTLSVGVLIDDAIVVRDNIVRHQQSGAGSHDAAVQGTVRIARAVASTTLAIVAVFMPLLLAGGPLGPFVRQFAATVAVAVVASLIVSFTVDPALSVLLGGRVAPASSPPERHWSRAWVQRALRFRVLVAAFAVLAVVGCIWLFRGLSTELLPEFDEAIATVDVQMPSYARPDYMATKVKQVEAAVREVPDVKSVMATVGTAQSRNAVNLFILLTPPDKRQRSFQEVEDAVRTRLSRVAGISTSPADRPVRILLSGPDDGQLDALRKSLVERLESVAGLVGLTSNDLESKQAVLMDLHRDRLADAGVSLDQVAGAIGAFASGAPISTWYAPNGRQYDVALRFPTDIREDLVALGDIELVPSRAPGAARPTPLRAVADIRVGDRARLIERVDGVRLQRVMAAVTGRSLGDVSKDVRKVLSSLAVPAGFQVTYGGKVRELEESQNDFLVATLLAVILVFCVLMMFFGGALLPLVIMVSIPLGCLGALAWMALAGRTLNAFSGVGLLLVAGLVVKNGILLVDSARQQEAQGLSRQDAICAAVALRMRPILMTSGAMLIGMLPVALGFGHGGEQLSAMGQSVVFGIISSTALSLLVIPVLYSLVPLVRRAPVRHSASSMT